MRQTQMTTGIALLSTTLLATPLFGQSSTMQNDQNRQDRQDRQTDRATNAQDYTPRYVRCDSVLGVNLLNNRSETIGEVDNLIIDLDNQRVRFAILDVDTEGFGGKRVAVPYDVLGWNGYSESWSTDIPVSKFERMPEFKEDNWESLYDAGWTESFTSHWNEADRTDWQKEMKRDSRKLGTPDHFTRSFRGGSMRTITGNVTSVETWSPDDSNATYRVLKVQDKATGRTSTVVLTAERYSAVNDLPKKGEQVTIYGAQHNRDRSQNTGNLYVARHIAFSGRELNIRDSDGRPASVYAADNQNARSDRDSDKSRHASTNRHPGGFVLASELEGQTVFANNEKAGSIETIVLDTNSGDVNFVVTSVGGWLGIGDDMYAIPVSAGHFDPDLDFHLPVGKSTLETAPKVEGDIIATVDKPGFTDRVYAFYNVERPERYGTGPRYSQESRDRSGGWGHQGEYQTLLRNGENVDMKLNVYDVTRYRPLQDMNNGVVLTTKAPDNTMYEVHMGPVWFIERQSRDFNRGRDIQVNGWKVKHNGQTFIVPRTITFEDGETITVRTAEGDPLWDAGSRHSRK